MWLFSTFDWKKKTNTEQAKFMILVVRTLEIMLEASYEEPNLI
jgi:hypothetical protein